MNNLALFTSTLSLTLLWNSANANGINPPRPTGSFIVEAKCTEKKGATILSRARLNPAGIEIRLSATETITVKLADIRTVKLSNANSSADGFIAAIVELVEPQFAGKAAIKVGSGTESHTLSGFSANKRRVTIPIGNCSSLNVTIRPADDFPKEEAKK